MLPIEAFTFLSDTPKPGQIIVVASKGISEPHLIFEWHGNLEALKLAGEGKHRFASFEAMKLPRPRLVFNKWRLEVDPASALTGAKGEPEPGFAYIDAGGPGFVGKMNSTEVLVPLTGNGVKEHPDYGFTIAPFWRWRVVVDLPEPGSVYEVARSGAAAV